MTTQSSRQELFATVTDKLIARIQAGNLPPWKVSWKTGMMTSYHSDRAYSGMNQFILMLEKAVNGYTSNYWVAFGAIKEAQGKAQDKPWAEQPQIKKGASPVTILRPRPGSVDEVQSDGTTTTRHFLRFDTAKVWNEDQLLNWTPKEVPTVPPMPIEAIEALLANLPNRPVVVHRRHEQPSYVPRADKILMPLLADFKISTAYYAVRFHEEVHATGHSSRLKRDGVTCYETRSGALTEVYSYEELVAEMGAAFLCAHTGLEPEPAADHASYLANWASFLKDEPTAYLNAAAEAQKAADYILGKDKADDTDS